MKAVFLFICWLVLALAAALVLSDEPGSAHIVWHSYVIDASAVTLLGAIFALGFFIYVLFRIFHFTAHGPVYWRMSRTIKKLRQAHDDLADGLIAIAAGDAAEAGRFALAARKAVGDTVLCQLLQAQAARLAGDDSVAREIFQRLAADARSAVLGYRGLMTLAQHNGDAAEAARLADRLYQSHPRTPWLGLIRFDLLVQRQQWDEANLILAQIVTARLLDPQLAKKLRAALLVASSQELARQRRADLALQRAEQAMKQTKDWLPAVINLAQRQSEAEHHRAARHTIERYWPTLAHPQLAALYRPDKTDPLDHYKYLKRLCGDDLSPTAKLVLAEAAFDAALWGEARHFLNDLIAQGAATQAAYRLMANLARRENGDDTTTLRWLTQGEQAQSDPAWLCDTCNGAHEEWQAACRHCNAFNTISWRAAGQGQANPLISKNEIKRVEWQDVIVP